MEPIIALAQHIQQQHAQAEQIKGQLALACTRLSATLESLMAQLTAQGIPTEIRKFTTRWEIPVLACRWLDFWLVLLPGDGTYTPTQESLVNLKLGPQGAIELFITYDLEDCPLTSLGYIYISDTGAWTFAGIISAGHIQEQLSDTDLMSRCLNYLNILTYNYTRTLMTDNTRLLHSRLAENRPQLGFAK